MNKETIISVMKFVRDTCKSNENCSGCIFRLYNDGTTECGLQLVPCRWKLTEPIDWKVFKE